MIEFTSTQLSWIVIAACSVGGTGYMTLNEKIESLDKKVAVSINTIENNNKQLEKLIVKVEQLNIILADNQRRNK